VDGHNIEQRSSIRSHRGRPDLRGRSRLVSIFMLSQLLRSLVKDAADPDFLMRNRKRKEVNMDQNQSDGIYKVPLLIRTLIHEIPSSHWYLAEKFEYA